MNKPIVVLSVFDGMSCGLVALKSLYPDRTFKYYAAEIDPAAIAISRHNHPNTIYLGDVRSITKDTIPEKVDILIGGSPCQSFSNAGQREGFDGKSNLFWEFVRLKKLFNPTYFMLENVNMRPEWMSIITNSLSVAPIRINSSLVSAQYRDRFYWTNIPNVTVPKDRGINISDVISDAVGGAGIRNSFGGRYHPNGKKKWDVPRVTIRKDNKSNCLTCSTSCAKIGLKNGHIRPLTIREMEILQTLPVGYTNVPGISKTTKIRSIGNGWTIEAVKHIFSFLPF